MSSIDLKIFDAINNLPGRWLWLDKLGVFFAVYTAWFMLGMIVFIVVTKRHRHNLLMACTALGAAFLARGIIVELIRLLYHRARPYFGNDFAVYRLLESTKWSFPSGHASLMFAIATAVYFYNKTLGLIFFIVSILAGFARIYTGVHWPSDILAGAVIGILSAFVVRYLLQRNWVKRIIEPWLVKLEIKNPSQG